ncbi:MAG: PIG-L family deacetylase [Saprospiraceae bacterium]|nr:PIG-L family deacetylase [Saprospiraceae bacterium]
MLRTTAYLIGILLFFSTSLQAQKPDQYTSADLHAAIAKLQVLGSALFVAAHPDDENTRMISWLSNERKVRAGYLSLTRGDGGQNLIGPEIQELLGVIRTQELLAARRIDGGEQLFSRANDFGYSKHPDETLAIWNKDEVLADAVWAIRKFRPDIVINRFDHESAGKTHGHHTASAIISYLAFDLAGDPNAFPEQLEFVDTWQPRRLFLNTSWWFYGSREKFAEADKTNMVVLDVGVYYPWIGKSNTEIAAESRSMHQCQGMGNTPERGSQLEYLDLLKGDRPENPDDPFSGIPTDWSRLEGGAPIGALLQQIQAEFDYFKPYLSVDKLLQARKMIQEIEDDYWRKLKLGEIDEIIYGCLGLYLDATAANQTATPGEQVTLKLEAINRSPVSVWINHIIYEPTERDSLLKIDLLQNEKLAFETVFSIPENFEYTSPYWLDKPGTLGMYAVEEQQLRGLPETIREIAASFELVIAGVPIKYTRTVSFKQTDPVDGEVYSPFEILPKAFVSIADPVYVFGNSAAKPVDVIVRAGIDQLSGRVELVVPEGWRTDPRSYPVDLAKKGAEKAFSFSLFPPEGASEADIHARIITEDQTFDRSLIIIDYDHIPTQSILLPASARAVKVDLKKAGDRIAYIMGAGDEIPASLEQIGYQVDLLEVNDLTLDQLKTYDALILGVRAYNTIDRIEFAQPLFMQYVEQGGTMIVQFNTAHRLKVPGEEIGPYPIEVSRDRVSVEEAEVRLLATDHPVLNTPNKITSADFNGWIQERGLYFSDQWDEHYTAILSSNDPGEPARDGGLLVAPYGEGFYIYTGYAWFRQLPAGVPGAYRLFTNLISLGQDEKP